MLSNQIGLCSGNSYSCLVQYHPRNNSPKIWFEQVIRIEIQGHFDTVIFYLWKKPWGEKMWWVLLWGKEKQHWNRKTLQIKHQYTAPTSNSSSLTSWRSWREQWWGMLFIVEDRLKNSTAAVSILHFCVVKNKNRALVAADIIYKCVEVQSNLLLMQWIVTVVCQGQILCACIGFYLCE